ncbi:glycoside hydrolase family 43 protein [Rhizosphaericola mali]|uniref:Family 43 glycosylhydrolase n=1 Tax=Rhizosphaericola mali TaxID=2545455 RepID=A0A5P2G017_9BACT|nr:glycoside hydrolase family 43 protein [Rhizosphaericola mali]QES89134.1 family 43 glycosylhydrolase [Rhizosphaericola mali]
MNTKYISILIFTIILNNISLNGIAQKVQYDNIKPDRIWLDNNGDTINAHGGDLLFANGKYYWFGEKRGAAHSGGVNVYSSKDLYNWKFEKLALGTSSTIGSDIETGCIMERPKVIYNAKTKMYVMWFHLELKDKGYAAARAGIATSKSITGPYIYKKSFRPNGNMSRDMNLFVDDDGTAYHIYSSNENYDMRIVKLTQDYLDVTKEDTMLFSQQREAPVMIKENNTYYLLTSACTGWRPNKGNVYSASTIFGPYKELYNPFHGPNADISFFGQPAFAFKYQKGKQPHWIYVGDKWNPKNLKDSRYQWLPITFEKDMISIDWNSDWKFSTLK